MNATATEPRVYVGTYHKYNSGSLKGAWLSLEDYGDYSEFLDACKELHQDELDPELMFQDYEGFPESYYHESVIDASLWEWLELDENDRIILEIYRDNIGSGDIDEAREHYAGEADSIEDWAADWLEETGELSRIPENLRYYFDYEKYARDLQYSGDIWTERRNGTTYIFWS